jgi:tetratricopeptide (TPR) repeat protein
VPAPVQFKYRAFLSYAHADTRWARWLHGKLEGFRIDKDLVSRATAAGPVPRTLRPIFRDREDFSGGHTLTEATVAALDASAALIVLCSPVAAMRPAVNEEVRLFRSRHPDRPVIPVIVEGSYPDNFPPALRYELAPDGTVTDRPVTFLAPDLREEGDGRELALAKVVARLIGLPPDDVFRRAERARRRSASIRNGIIGVLALLVVAAGLSAYLFREELKRNEALLEATLKTATEIVNTAVAQAEKYNVPRTATVEMLTRAEALFDNMARLGRPTPAMQRQKAWMLIEFARNYAILGDTTKQRQRAEEAHRIMAALAPKQLDDAEAQRALAAAHDERGNVLVAQGNLPGALESHRASLAIRESLAKADPGNTRRQRDLSVALSQVGIVLRDQGNLPGALESHRASLAIRERLAKVDPGNAGWQQDLSQSQILIGDVLRAQGNLPGALESYRASHAIFERLAKADPGNAGWQRDLSASLKQVGNVLRDQGNLPGALESYRASLAIAERLANADPGNALWQRDLSVALNQVGIVLRDQGNLPGALESHRASLAIADRLAKADPGNAGWQRDLAISHGLVAMVLARTGQTAEALDGFRQGRDIIVRLRALSPTDAGLPRDLAWFEAQIAALAK